MTGNRHVLKKQKIEEKNKDSSKTYSQLPALPTALEDLILDYVDHTDKTFDSKNYSPESVGVSLFEKRLPVFTLLQHAVRGEYKEVNAMLTKNPLLLLEKDTVTDYSGRKHSKRTVYQIALGACDYHVKAEDGKIVQKGMVEMIAEHFKNLPGKTSEEINHIMQTQYQEQFPELYDAKEAEKVASKIAADAKALTNIIDAIDKASEEDCRLISAAEKQIHTILRKENPDQEEKALREIVQSVMKASSNDFEAVFEELVGCLVKHHVIQSDFFNVDLLKALYQFRNHLEPKRIQTTGKHFNHQLLADVARLYDDNYERFGNDWDRPKNLMCWQKVFGFIERFVPACDAHIISQGIWSILKYGDDSQRSLKFAYSGGSFFPLDSDPSWEIGYNCGAEGEAGPRQGEGPHPQYGWDIAGIFKTYVEQKHRRWELMRHPDSLPQKSSCVIL